MRQGRETALAAGSRRESGAAPVVGLRLLGGFRVEREGEAVPDSAWPRKSGKLLVKMLAVASEHRLHREVLIDRLWPEADPTAAGNSLHQAILVVRRVMDASRSAAKRESCIRLSGDMVTLITESVSIDIDKFENLARYGLRSREVDELTSAVDIYGGELLPEDRYEDWAEGRREHLARLYAEVLVSLAEALQRRGALFAATERARQALAADVSREDTHRLLMRLYALTGHRHQALRQFRLCSESLAVELGVEPDSETAALHESILSGELEGMGPDVENELVALPSVPRRRAVSSFAGRERPLSVFRDKLEQLRAGSGGTVLISGEAGVGKTRLAVAAAASAHETGVLVLWGTSYAEEGRLPYSALAEALEEYLDALPARARERLAQSHPDLTRLIASGNAPITDHQQTDGTHMQLFASVGRFLSEIGTTRPVMLVLDDLHAADELSVQLVHYLARLAQKHPWLLVVTYREEEVRPGDAMHGVVTACVRHGLADRIELLRLSRSEASMMTRSLLEGEIDDVLLSELFSSSLGNALFLQELVNSMRQSGQIEHAGARWQIIPKLSRPVPPGATELVTARAARLSPDAARVAGLAAVVGTECSPALLREASGLAEAALIDVLDEIVAMHIMEDRPSPDGRPNRYAFRHPLFREAIYAQISSPRRQHLHATVATVMEKMSPDDADALAYQWSRTANDAKAAQYLELAGDRAAARYAQEIAVTLYRDSMSRLGAQQEPERMARLQSKLGKVLTQTGQYDDALLLFDASRRYYEFTENLEELARTVALLVRAHRQQGTSGEGLAVGQALLPRIGDGDDLIISLDAAIELYVALAGAARAAGHLDETVRWAEQAAAWASATGNDQALAMAESRRGDAIGAMGRTAEAVCILDEVRGLAERTGNLTTVAEIYLNAGAFYTVLGDSKKGQEYRARAADLCERLGYPAHQAFALSELATAQFDEGLWDEARRTASRVLEIHESIDVSWYLPYALCILGDMEMHSGERDRAHDFFSRAYTLATERYDPQALASVVRGLADIDLLDGRPDAARSRLSGYLAERDTDTVDPIHIAPALVDALVELNELGEAEDLLSRALAEAETVGLNGGLLARLLTVKGRLQARQERWNESESTLRDAIALAASASTPMNQGRAWFEMGALAVLRGDAGEGRASFRHALTIFQSLGAQPWLERTQSALVEIG